MIEKSNIDINNKILWVDDEIDLLLPHVKFLERKGYRLTTSTNGRDAISLVTENRYDLVILDEMMLDMDGLTTLKEIKKIDPAVNAIMLTKSEEESIFLEAIGNMISDYLTKPISPMQLYLTCKKNIDQRRIISDKIIISFFRKDEDIRSKINDGNLDFKDWFYINKEIFNCAIELDQIENIPEIISKLDDLINYANKLFSIYIEKNYPSWINERIINFKDSKIDDETFFLEDEDVTEGFVGKSKSKKLKRPLLLTDFIEKFVIEDFKHNENQKTALIVIDCLRYDQMKIIESILRNENFIINSDNFLSILPTTALFTRNALFSGLFQSEIDGLYPEYSAQDISVDDTSNHNKFEHELLIRAFNSNGIELEKGVETGFFNLYRHEAAKRFNEQIDEEIKGKKVVSVVLSFINFLIHDKFKSELLNEMVSSDKSYRAMVKNWFVNSNIKSIITKLVRSGYKVIITTNHGSKQINKFTKVKSDGALSIGTRFKIGSNISSSNKKQTFFIQSPSKYKLSEKYKSKNIVLAKEDHCFIFENDSMATFFQRIKGTYQHGGVSMEEMILPVLEIKEGMDLRIDRF